MKFSDPASMTPTDDPAPSVVIEEKPVEEVSETPSLINLEGVELSPSLLSLITQCVQRIECKFLVMPQSFNFSNIKDT